MALDPNFDTDPVRLRAVHLRRRHRRHRSRSTARPAARSDPGPDATGNGAVVSGRLSRLRGQRQRHDRPGAGAHLGLAASSSPATRSARCEFGPDGALYASGGDGASFNYVDYGQTRQPASTIPVNEGGALRSQDLRSSGDPVTLDGSIIRIDPDTGAGLSDNPLAGTATPTPGASSPTACATRSASRSGPGTNESLGRRRRLGQLGGDQPHRRARPTPSSRTSAGRPTKAPAARPATTPPTCRCSSNCTPPAGAAVTSPYYAYPHAPGRARLRRVRPAARRSPAWRSTQGGNYPSAFRTRCSSPTTRATGSG